MIDQIKSYLKVSDRNCFRVHLRHNIVIKVMFSKLCGKNEYQNNRIENIYERFADEYGSSQVRLFFLHFLP